jgi:hypothetical protein
MKIRRNSLLFFLAGLFFLTSCSTTRSSLNQHPVKIQEFERDEYVVLDRVKGEAKSYRFWILFIPIGGKSDQKLYEKAYDNAIKSAIGKDADGILQPRYSYKKTSIPLILIGWTTKKVSAEGKAFRIKNEEEYQKSKNKN